MTIFTHCESGHDLRLEDAYIYLSGGMRACRTCVQDKKPKRARPSTDATVGAFNA